MLFGNEKLSFETLDFLWTIAPFSIRFSTHTPQGHSFSIHKDIEFHYVFEGNEVYILNGHEHPIGKGDLVCVNSYTPHNYYSLAKGKSVTLIVSTDHLAKNGLNPSTLRFNECIRDAAIGEMILKIVTECNGSGAAHDLSMNAMILSLIAYLATRYARTQTKEEAARGLMLLGAQYRYVCRAIDYISENFTNAITLDELCALCGLSKYHFIRVFKQVTGDTPNEYVNKIRLKYAKQLLLKGANVTEAATASGFSDAHYFSNCFKKYEGCRPSQIKNSAFDNDL